MGVTLIVSNLFWAWQLHRAINKLMSRNYAEYHQLNNPAPETAKEIKLHVPDIYQEMGVLSGFGVG